MENVNVKWANLAPVFSDAEQELQQIAQKKQAQKQKPIKR